MRLYIKLVTFSLLILAVSAACVSKQVATVKVNKAAVIDLNPTGPAGPITNPGIFNINTPNNGCVRGSGPRKGCVRFTANEDGTITFALNGSAPAKSCDQHAMRVITKIELTATDASPGSQPSPKGDFSSSSYPMAAMFKTYGFPALNVNTGVVYAETATQAGVSKVVVENKNTSINPAPGGVIIWYKVTVKKCSDGKFWVTDPRAENDGME